LDLSWEVWEQRPVAIEVLTLFIVFRLFARCDGCFGLLLTILMFFASGVLRCCPGCLTHCLRERDVSMSILADLELSTDIWFNIRFHTILILLRDLGVKFAGSRTPFKILPPDICPLFSIPSGSRLAFLDIPLQSLCCFFLRHTLFTDTPPLKPSGLEWRWTAFHLKLSRMTDEFSAHASLPPVVSCCFL
jgi:hypothetical protein